MILPAQFKPLEITFTEPENPFAKPPPYQDSTVLLLAALLIAAVIGLFLYYRNSKKD